MQLQDAVLRPRRNRECQWRVLGVGPDERVAQRRILWRRQRLRRRDRQVVDRAYRDADRSRGRLVSVPSFTINATLSGPE